MPKKQEEYEVQAIIGKRRKKNSGIVQYRVLWKGYPKEQATWEPEDHLQNVYYMIEEFNRKVQQKNTQLQKSQQPAITTEKQQKIFDESQKVIAEIKKKEQTQPQSQMKAIQINKPVKKMEDSQPEDEYTPNRSSALPKTKPQALVQRSNNHIMTQTPSKQLMIEKKSQINGHKFSAQQKPVLYNKNIEHGSRINNPRNGQTVYGQSNIPYQHQTNVNQTNPSYHQTLPAQHQPLIRKSQINYPPNIPSNQLNGLHSQNKNSMPSKICQQKDDTNNKPQNQIYQSNQNINVKIHQITFSDSQQQDNKSDSSFYFQINGVYLSKTSKGKNTWAYSVFDKRYNRRMCLTRSEIIRLNPKILIRFYQQKIVLE